MLAVSSIVDGDESSAVSARMTGMRKRREPRVADVVISRVGFLKAARVLAFQTQWAICSASLGRPITRQDYAEWWKESERNVYRHLADFRAAFPGMSDPQLMADLAQQRAAGWQARGVDGFGQLPAAVLDLA